MIEKFSVNVRSQSIEKAKNREVKESLRDLPKEEIEKTAEQIEMIKIATRVVSDTLAHLGFVNDFTISPEQILIAKKGIIETADIGDDEKKQSKLSKNASFHKIIHGHIVMHEDLLQDKQAFYHALIHELFHSASQNYAFLTKENDDFDERFIGKTGYASYYNDSSKIINRFAGLNEAITEELTREGLKLKGQEILPQENTTELLDVWENTYSQERRLLYSIILEMSGGDDKKIQNIWEEFIKNYLSGNLMGLRKIERYFGEGSLKLLAEMEPCDGNMKNFLKNEKIIKYFSGIDKKEKDEILKEIL